MIAGLAGTREHDGRLSFAPRLPEPLTRIAFPFAFQGRQLQVEISPAATTYWLSAGAPLEIEHWGGRFTVTRETAAVRSIPPAQPVDPLRQPFGRAPTRRQPHVA